MRWLSLTLMVFAIPMSCSLPAEDEGFSSRDPAMRVRAAALSERDAGEETLTDLISTLDSDDPAARMVASASLRRQTGQDFGYDATAPEPERKVSADRWEAWYRRTYLGQDAPDPVTGETRPEDGRMREVRSPS